MSGPRLFNATRWSLGSYDGETIGWLIGDASCLAGLTSSLEHVSDLVGELDTGDAPSYARGTIDVVTDQVGETTVLIRDPESSVPSTDTTGGTPAVVVFYDPSGGSDATDLLLSALPIAEGPGYSDWEVDPSSGIAAVYDNADLDDLAHGSLLGRTDPDQHPISAITGLATALADLGDAPSGLVGSVTVTPSSGVADVAAAVEGGAAGVVVNGVSESLTEITMPDPATTGPFTMIIAADAGILDSLTWTDDLVGEYDSGFFFPVDIGSGKENVAIRAIPGSASWLLSPILPNGDATAADLVEFLAITADKIATTPAGMLASSTVVDAWEALAPGLGVVEPYLSQVSAVIGFAVADDGDEQAGVNTNASFLHATAIAMSQTTRAQLATLDAEVDAALPLLRDDTGALAAIIAHGDTLTPAAWAQCGYGEGAYGASAERGYWSCPTLLPSPSTSWEDRGLVRLVRSPSSGNGNQYQEFHSEEINGGIDGADRFESAVATINGRPEAFAEKTPTGAVIEDLQLHAGILPAGVWMWLRTYYDLATNTLTVSVNCDGQWDTETADGMRWLTLGSLSGEGTGSIAASTESVQWIGRGAGLFDVARVRTWIDGAEAMDADFTGAADAATSINDAVLESAPSTAAVWTAQDQAEVDVAAASTSIPLSYLDTDDTLAADSDAKVPSQQAVKAYVDANAGGGSPAHPVMLVKSGYWTSNVYPAGSTVAQVDARLYFSPLWLPTAVDIDRIGIYHASGVSTTGTITLGLYTADSGFWPDELVTTFGTVDPTTAAAAMKAVPGTWTLPAGFSWLAIRANFTGTAPTVNAFTSGGVPYMAARSVADGMSNQFPLNTSGGTGALPDPAATNAATTTQPIVYVRAV